MSLLKFYPFKCIYRKYSSALYITGDKAQKSFAVLTPVVDFDERLMTKSELVENVKCRGLNIDIDKIEERWAFFKQIEKQKLNLEKTRFEIGQTIAALMKNNAEHKLDEEINKLKIHLKIIKQDFKHIKDASYSIEEDANLQVLDLPNILHTKTPKNNELQIYSYLEKPEGKAESHIKIGEDKNYIKFINPMTVYLNYDAALFEFGIQSYFCTELNHYNYLQFSNADFVKSVVVEGCGTDPYDNSEVLTMDNIHCVNSNLINRLHLVGASSLYSFVAYFTKHSVQSSYLPIKAFAIGRKYRTIPEHSTKSLFNINQSSEIGIFQVSTENFVLKDILNEVVELYKQLGYHFRVTLIPAHGLYKSESLRLSIQMFSNHLDEYVEVGYVSYYEDYISKRLLLNYIDNNERKYPFTVGGSLINIHKVLGCVLENTFVNNERLMSDILYKYTC